MLECHLLKVLGPLVAAIKVMQNTCLQALDVCIKRAAAVQAKVCSGHGCSPAMLLLLRVLLQQVVMAVLLLQVELLVLVVVMAGDMPHNLLHMHQCWDLK